MPHSSYRQHACPFLAYARQIGNAFLRQNKKRVFCRPGSMPFPGQAPALLCAIPRFANFICRNPIRLESGKAPPCPPAFRSRKDCFLFALRPHGRFINGAFPRGLLLICERCKSEAFFQNNAHAPHIRRLILC